ncbi:MAG: aspartate 1-decarboxylase [Elusimicrobiota bacterium]
MLRRMCRAKIHRATITSSRLDYEGSIEIDQKLMEAADILEHEMVLIANLSNGQRFETYVIKGPKNSGTIGLNGAAARLGGPGDKIIVMSVAWMEEEAAHRLIPKFVRVNDKNKIIAIKTQVDRSQRKN